MSTLSVDVQSPSSWKKIYQDSSVCIYEIGSELLPSGYLVSLRIQVSRPHTRGDIGNQANAWYQRHVV
jgi:hypothetical protein